MYSVWITLPVLIRASVHNPILALAPVRALNHYLVLDPNFALYPSPCLAPVTSPLIFISHSRAT
jgi:hypothetical protein